MFEFVLKYKFIILFYLILILLLFFKRKRVIVQAKIIILYRMKFGLKFIEKISQKFREIIILLGYISVGAGYVGLIFISYILIKNLYDLIISPATTSGVSLVLPGVNIPGLGILPFWYWLAAIFIIALVHEFSHGIVAQAHNVKIKNTGIVLLGPIIGAFVEPDENKVRKEKDIVQYSILAAGPFSNIILALIALLLLNFAFMPLQELMVEPAGFTFDSYYGDNMPFEQAGILPGTIITEFNNVKINKFQDVNDKLYCSSPQDKVKIVGNGKNYNLILKESPDYPGRGFLGINQIRNEVKIKEKYQKGVGKIAFYTLEWFNGLTNGGKGFLFWLFLLSLGIGLFNLLPLPIVDGGRMVQITMHKFRGEEKGEKSYRKISLFFLLILILTLVYPFLIKLL